MNNLSNLQSELVVLSALLRDDVARKQYSYLTHEHFYYMENQSVFQAIIELLKADKPISKATVLAQLEKDGNIADIDMEYMHKVESYRVPSAHVEACARDLEGYRYTRVVLEGSRMLSKAIEDGESIDLSLNEFNKLLGQTIQAQEKDGLGDIFSNLFDEYSSDKKVDKFLTGIPCIDKVTNGFARGELVTIGAKSGVGKSTLSLRIALNMFKREDIKILMISREMSKEQIGERIIATHTDIDKKTFEEKSFTEKDWQRIVNVMETYGSDKFIIDTRSKTIEDIKRRVIKEEPDILIVDYLQLLTPLDSKVSRERQIADMSRELKNLTLDNDMVVIQLSQLAEKGIGNYRPTGESHIRESRAPYHDSNIVIYIHQPSEDLEMEQIRKSSSLEFFQKMSKDEFKEKMEAQREECGLRLQEIIVDKNRNGETLRKPYIVNMRNAFYAPL